MITTTEHQIGQDLIAKLRDLKDVFRHDIRDRTALENNFRQKFEALNRVRFTDGEKYINCLGSWGFNWISRCVKNFILMRKLMSPLHKFAQGREIFDLTAYEEGR